MAFDPGLPAEAKRATLAELLRKQARAPKRFPLSPAQQRIWFFEQLVPGTALYNCPSTVQLEGRLDTGALERGIAEMVCRHEALRTTFAEVDGVAVQVVAPELRIPLQSIDLSAVGEEM